MLDFREICSNVFLIKEDRKRSNRINCLLIKDKDKKGNILIDPNFSFPHIDELYSKIPESILAIILSHFHVDHCSRAYYHEEKYHKDLYCPVQEESYFKSIPSIIKDVGYEALGLTKSFLFFMNKIVKFKECHQLKTYHPDKDVLEFKSIKLETIHIPGHSPGQTAFIINSEPMVLYASDIGSYPYYGDFISNLKNYKKSIDKLEDIYLSDDFILIPSHGNIYLKKDDQFFERIRQKIEKNEQLVLNSLTKSRGKSIKELVLERIITPESRINPPLKDLYLLWDGGMIFNHLINLIENNYVKKIEANDFLNDKYILI